MSFWGRLWSWLTGPKHGSADFDGYFMTCHCGYSDRSDWDLKTHLAKEGVAQ